jgi:polysaccharide biosynthesis/export protein
MRKSHSIQSYNFGKGDKMKQRVYLGIAALLVFPIGLLAQKAPTKTAAPQPAPQASSISDDFVIGLEDVLAVNVWKEPELSVKDIVVRPDGKIGLPLVNDIQASGLTPKQLQDDIAAKLKSFVASPVVTVTVTKVTSRSVSVVGEVRNPGVYLIGSPLTALEILAKAGGFTELARTKKIRIIRKEKDKTLQFELNYKDIASGKNLQQNIVLKGGDVVIVP